MQALEGDECYEETLIRYSVGAVSVREHCPYVRICGGAYKRQLRGKWYMGTGVLTFSPDADCTCGQIVTFLSKVYNK